MLRVTLWKPAELERREGRILRLNFQHAIVVDGDHTQTSSALPLAAELNTCVNRGVTLWIVLVNSLNDITNSEWAVCKPSKMGV